MTRDDFLRSVEKLLGEDPLLSAVDRAELLERILREDELHGGAFADMCEEEEVRQVRLEIASEVIDRWRAERAR